MTFANKIARIKCSVIFLLRLDLLASQSVFITKFVCTNLTLKASVAKVLNSGVVIYLS